ncbi:MAG TPA: hypothetical protein VND91_00735 [Candidatus Saccharimonadia bacterium]|nr:hypothetical protein [Candidatus Saccharimonadia bacterium]
MAALLKALLFSNSAAAAAPVELRYGDTPAEVLTIHADDARGALPVVVHYGSPGRALIDLLALRGYVLVVVPLPENPSTTHRAAAAADALAFVARRIASHGGDPDRLHLAGTGAAAATAARLGADVEMLPGRRVRRDAVDAIALRGGRAYAPAVGQETPPTLLLHASDDALARRDAERYAARLRESGGSAEVAAIAGGARGEGAAIVAWFDAASIARVGRFEQLAFEPAADVPTGLATLVAARRHLLAGDGAAPRVVRKDAPAAPWRVEHDFGERYASIAALAVADASVCALLRGADAALAYSCRGRRWSKPAALPLAAPAGARNPALLVTEASGRAAVSFVSSGGRIVRVESGAAARIELDGDAPVLALAWVDGHA